MSASKVGYLIRQVGCPHRGADTKTSPLGNTEQGNTGLEDNYTEQGKRGLEARKYEPGQSDRRQAEHKEHKPVATETMQGGEGEGGSHLSVDVRHAKTISDLIDSAGSSSLVLLGRFLTLRFI